MEPGACSRAEGDGMAIVYVLQVMAHHGYGLEGWRTVRKPSGEPYSFETREAAQAALQQHFSNLRDGLNVPWTLRLPNVLCRRYRGIPHPVARQGPCIDPQIRPRDHRGII